MNEREAAQRQRLLAAFREEAHEKLASLSRSLLHLERAAGEEETARLVEIIFREAHSLKGASRAVNFSRVEMVCQSLESVFAIMKRGELKVSPQLIDILLRAVRILESLLAAGAGESAVDGASIAELVKILASVEKGELLAPTEPAPAKAAIVPELKMPPPPPREPAHHPAPTIDAAPHVEDSIRVPAARLDAVRVQTEELLAERLALTQLTAELRELKAYVVACQKEWAKARRVLRPAAHDPSGAAQSSARLAGLLEWSDTFVGGLDQRIGALAQSSLQIQRTLTVKTDALLDDSCKLLMLPCSWLLDGIRHTVRDLARSERKDIELRIEGDGFEMDRRILTELKDPFVHIMRNCLDHGIEPQAERLRSHKPPTATISVTINPVPGNRIQILISDDGRGIDLSKVRASAIRLGIIDPARAAEMDDNATADLVFRSALSTSPIITDLSGRGLGLAIVREKVERLGGTVSVESKPGSGTTFKVELPLSLTTFRGVVVRTGDHYFVLPTTNVERIVRASRKDIRTVENRETLDVGGQVASLVRLTSVLGLNIADAGLDGDRKAPALMVSTGSVRMAFLVDEVCQEQEVLIKPLGPQQSQLPAVTGATVLGTGKLAPVLDAADLVRAAIRLSETGTLFASGGTTAKAARRRSILVAEDSITSRTLLKNVLEGASYDVQTAVDDIDALTKLRSGSFDLLVSDVDMPRLSGLDLTARVRGDKKLSEIPIVLVTSLDSPRDRERGIEVGANAYIVKRSFEQSNLLEVIGRLL